MRSKPTKMTRVGHQWDGRLEELVEFVNMCTSNAKMLFGSVNNSIFLLMGDVMQPFAKDKDLKRYVKKVWKEWKDYEANLKYGPYCYFDPDDMSAETRALYSEGLTKQEYFEFWTSSGFEPYKLIRPFCLCLANKYKLFLERNGVSQPKEKGMLMMLVGRFELAREIHRRLIISTAKNCGVLNSDFEKAYACYSLRRVFEAYMKLVHEAIPELRYIYPDEFEQKGFDMIQTQINETVDTLDFYLGGVENASKGYDEIFAGKKAQKEVIKDVKVLRRIITENYDDL